MHHRNAAIVSPAGPFVGGLGTAAAAAAEGFGSCGLEVEFLTLPSEDSLAERIARRRPLRRYPRVIRSLGRRKLSQAARRADWDLAYAMPGSLPQRPDRILHQATFHPEAVLEQVAAARARAGGGRGPMSPGESRQYLRELGSAELIRVESEAVESSLLDRGIAPEKLVRCAPGVNLQRFTPSEKPPELRVAFVGTLSLWKGVDVLVALERALRATATVSVIGGPVCTWSRRLTADAPFDRTVTDVPALLAMSHVLVLPSATDGFGYVVLEALASGCIPVVTPTVGAAELVRRLRPDLVVEPEDMVERVRELAGELPAPELSGAARRIAEDFEWSAQAHSGARSMLDRLSERA
jgi:glycosyltransferase involved in cell wall biosynthesis